MDEIDQAIQEFGKRLLAMTPEEVTRWIEEAGAAAEKESSDFEAKLVVTPEMMRRRVTI